MRTCRTRPSRLRSGSSEERARQVQARPQAFPAATARVPAADGGLERFACTGSADPVGESHEAGRMVDRRLNSRPRRVRPRGSPGRASAWRRAVAPLTWYGAVAGHRERPQQGPFPGVPSERQRLLALPDRGWDVAVGQRGLGPPPHGWEGDLEPSGPPCEWLRFEVGCRRPTLAASHGREAERALSDRASAGRPFVDECVLAPFHGLLPTALGPRHQRGGRGHDVSAVLMLPRFGVVPPLLEIGSCVGRRTRPRMAISVASRFALTAVTSSPPARADSATA